MDEKEEAQKIQEQAQREAEEKAAKAIEEKRLAEQKSADEEKRNQEKNMAEPKSPLEEARALDKSIKAGNAEFKSLLDRQEKILADSQLAGKGLAGQSQATPKDVLKKQKAIEAWKGTPIADAIEKYG